MADDRKILLVDDSEEQQIFLSRILEDHGYEYNVAANGQEAIELIKQNPPSLVLLDIMMPGKTGLNVLQFIKRDEKLKPIPVIIVSGAAEITGVSLKTGQADFSKSDMDIVAQRFGEVIHGQLEDFKPAGLVEKPVNPEELIFKIKKFLPD